MNVKFLFFVLLSLLVAFSACNKEDETGRSANRIPLIKTIVTTGNYSDSVHFEYDSTGRIIKASHSSEQYTLYTYAPNIVTIHTYRGSSLPDYTSSYRLNDKGIATSTQIDGYLYTFKYDSIGYLVSKMYNNDTINSMRIKDGNTLMKKEYYLRDKSSFTWNYEFNTNNNTIGDENKGISWNGKQDKNLLTKETRVYKVYNSVQVKTTEYTYEYDTQNRVTKRTTFEYGDLYLTEYYTYY